MAGTRVFEAMNGIRGIAAIVVVIDHCATFGWFKGPLAHQFVDYGPLAVDLFFVMSGFVIAHAYGERLAQGMTTKAFLLTRLIRLYPLYILGIGVGCITPLISLWHQGHIVEAQYAAFASAPFALAMLPSPITIDASQVLYPLNGPAWSLFFELVINLIYAATWKRWTTGNLLIVVGISGAALWWSHDLSGGWSWQSLPIGFFRILYSFPAGVLVYLAYSKSFDFRSLYLPVSVGSLAAFVLLPNFQSKMFAVVAAFPMLVAFATQIKFSRLPALICDKVGAASYAVYAIHDPLLQLFNNIVSKFGENQYSTKLGVLFVCLIVPTCLVLDRAYDHPIRAALSRKLLTRVIPVHMDTRKR